MKDTITFTKEVHRIKYRFALPWLGFYKYPRFYFREFTVYDKTKKLATIPISFGFKSSEMKAGETYAHSSPEETFNNLSSIFE